MDALRSERLRRRRGGHCRVATPAVTDDDAVAKAVLVDVVAQPELQSEPHLLELLLERNELELRAGAVRRRLLRADVHDRHGRWSLALARERAPADVAQPPPHDLLRVDLDDEQRLDESRCARDNRSLVVDHTRMPVEDQLVLAADRVAERDEARVVARARDEHLLALPFLADVVRR